jgi:hypothetical protein
MSTRIERSRHIAVERPCADRVHPLVYKAMIGLAAVMVVATASFWLDAPATRDVFMIAAGFILLAVAIPLALARIARRSRDAAPFERAAGGSFRDWRRGDFRVWGSRVRGSDAAIEILLPLAAVALGMLAFAIVAAIVLP